MGSLLLFPLLKKCHFASLSLFSVFFCSQFDSICFREITQQMPYTRIFFVVLFIITPALSIFFGKDCRSDRDCPRFLGSGRPGKCQVIPNYGCQIWNFFGGKKQCRDGAWCLQCLKNEDCSQVLSVRQKCQSGSCIHDTGCNADRDCPSSIAATEPVRVTTEILNARDVGRRETADSARGARELVGIALFVLVIGAIATKTNSTFEKH